MAREWMACFDLLSHGEAIGLEGMDFLVDRRRRPPSRLPQLADVTDGWARLVLMTQAIRMGTKDRAKALERYRQWVWCVAPSFLTRQQEYMQKLRLVPRPESLPDVRMFPPGSWLIHFTFRLAAPYFSKDDTEWYLVDNPMRKEWVFKVPYIAPSQWKGALRAAMRAMRGYTTREEETRDPQMRRLFGYAEAEDRRSGCLYFYPTFFDCLDLEVINPHSRRTGAGTQPIYFECVPAGAEGTFTLLYVPLTSDAERCKNPEDVAREDLKAVAEGIRAMMTRYGFGAKTSSGFGGAIYDAQKALVMPPEFYDIWLTHSSV